MTKLTTAIRHRDTQKALKLIKYRDLEPILALILFTFAHIILSPIAYLVIRFVLGEKEVRFRDFRFSYLDFMETADGHAPGYRPIHLAAIQGDVEVLEALSSRGIDINDGNKINQESTPLSYALGAGKTGAALWLLEHGANAHQNILFSAVSVPSNMQLLGRLIEKGANINATMDMRECSYAPGGDLLQWVRNVKNMTVLGRAILSNYDSDHVTVASLLQAGADPNKVITIENNPETALSIALRKHRWRMAVELLRGGASLCTTGVKTEYWPYRETVVVIFDNDMINVAFTLAAANNIILSAAQLGDQTDCYRNFQRRLAINQSVAPIATIAHESDERRVQPFVTRFQMQRNNRIVAQGIIIGVADSDLLIPETSAVQTPQTEIVVPSLPQSQNLQMRCEMTFPF